MAVEYQQSAEALASDSRNWGSFHYGWGVYVAPGFPKDNQSAVNTTWAKPHHTAKTTGNGSARIEARNDQVSKKTLALLSSSPSDLASRLQGKAIHCALGPGVQARDDDDIRDSAPFGC